jgi:hypothetical protein
MHRRAFIAGLAASASPAAYAQTAPAAPAPLYYYAGQAGRLTSDRDEQGGNPFATALCETLQYHPLTLEDFGVRMAAANGMHSRGWQQLERPRRLPNPKLRLDAKSQSRMALVLINADYSQSDAYSLPGARFDAKRVPEALHEAGFETTLALDFNVEDARRVMADFARRSADADIALVYVGGHGLQYRRTVYWMMGDYPERVADHLATHAIALPEIAASGCARQANLVLYASCRDDPFTQT